MKKVIIIGATSGIGEALTRQLVKKGYLVGGCGRNDEKLQILQKELGNQFVSQVLDIRDTHRIEPALEKLVSKLGGLDIFVVSSGISHKNALLEWEPEKDVLQTNVMGYTSCLTFAARYFLKQRKGHLVGITSLTKYFSNKSAPAYNASKIFESNYLDSLRFRLHGKNFYVSEIVPGFVNTPMLSRPDRTFWLVPVEKAAKQMIEGIEKKKKYIFVSKRWGLFRWILPILPDVVYRKVT
jgi:short-subunit dehydrogenase